jgi:hypothetical protein
MYRFAGLLVLLAAGLTIGAAWGATPPIVVGPGITTTAMAGSSSTTTAPSMPSPTPLASSASLVPSSSRAGARPVSLTLKLHYEMQCGNPGSGSLVVVLPSRMRLPTRFQANVASLDGKRIAMTRGTGASLRVVLPPPPQVMCDLIGPGTLTLLVTKAADIGNPVAAGTYAVSARAGTHAFKTTLTITA